MFENTIKKELKKFDLKEAKNGKPICTRDCRKARIICFDAKGDPCPIIALVEENGREVIYRFDNEGKNAYNKSDLDLMMLAEKKSGWVNIYPNNNVGSTAFSTKEIALQHAGSSVIDTVPINWKE